jgi:hypothetical protein
MTDRPRDPEPDSLIDLEFMKVQAWLEMSGVVDTHHRGIDDSDPRNEVTEEDSDAQD